MVQVHKSRWGYHPCDYETFLLLKKLNACFLRALHRYTAWKRWSRKQPHNRVIRKKMVDAQGCKVGSEVVGPMPEPCLCPFFTKREKVVSHRKSKGGPIKAEGGAERLHLEYSDLPEVYRAARTPVLREDLVAPLKYSPEEIRGLVQQVEAWYRQAVAPTAADVAGRSG
jgi:hypothetical protein